ncbi:MAG TPA: hypothetical protein VFZ48_00045, partial [Candidatus Saccharimonadales bacterium]
MNIVLAQAQAADAGSKWITIGLLALSIVALNWKGWTDQQAQTGPVAKIASVALGMGAFGIFLTILNIQLLKDWSKAVAGWIQLSPT